MMMFETSLKMFRKLKSVSVFLKTYGYDLVAIDSGSFLPKMRFLDILVVFRLDFGQSSFNLVEKAFATQQFVLLATGIDTAAK